MKYSIVGLVVLYVFFGFTPEEVTMQPLRQNMRDENASVSLVGEITSVEVKKGSAQYAISFKTKLRLKNTGKTPLIFLKEGFLFPGVTVAEKPEDFETGKLLTDSYGGMSCSQTLEKWVSLRKALDQSSPPTEKTFVLKPNEERIIDGEPVGLSVLVDPQKGFSSKEKESATWETIMNLSQILVKVQMEAYPAWGLEPDCYGSSFGKKLQKRWSSYGRLWLRDIRSEPIVLDLKSVVIN